MMAADKIQVEDSAISFRWDQRLEKIAYKTYALWSFVKFILNLKNAITLFILEKTHSELEPVGDEVKSVFEFLLQF